MYEISRNIQIYHKPFHVQSGLNVYKIVQTRLVQDSQNVLFKSESGEDYPKIIKCMENRYWSPFSIKKLNSLVFIKFIAVRDH